MLRSTSRSIIAVGLFGAITACGQVNAEQAAQLAADSARASGASSAEVTRRADRARTAAVAQDRTRTLTLATGSTLALVSVTDVTSQKDEAGKPFTARTVSASVNASGETVIPAGAELVGTVTGLQAAGSPGGGGILQVAFSTVRFGGADYPIANRVVSMDTRQVARGVTASDAAKVGVGAAIGAVAGRLIGHNGTGTAVGAVAGGAGGVVYASRTKDHDIALSPGSRMEVSLTGPFSRTVSR